VRTLGVEEEFMLVAPDGTPRSVAPAVLQHAASLEPEPSPAMGVAQPPGGVLVKELKQEQIETSTHPCADLAALTNEIRAGRARADASARHAGAHIAALATTPGVITSTISRDRRSRRINEAFGQTAREQLTCGCHVHVQVADDDEGVLVLDHLRPWTPTLLALSANSPFWQGADTGYASFRSQVWNRWPTAGAAPPFGDATTYHRIVDELVHSGTILDEKMIYFSARLSPSYPTVEVRVADVCLEVEDAVLQAALVRGLAETAIAERGGGNWQVQPRTEQQRIAMWRAARSGIRGDLISPTKGGPLPAAEVVGELLAHISDALERSGDLEWVRTQLGIVLARGTGADQQRAWRAVGADTGAVVRNAVERTLA
jgi:carboxylate-amine ligase